MAVFKKIAATAGALTLAFSLSACSGNGQKSEAKGTEANPVKIGVVDAGKPYWETYKQEAKAAGISVELVNFDDYAQPNPALDEKSIDVNQFQHVLYLARYNASANKNLVPIGATAIYPLGLYSKKYTSTDAIPAGSEIAIPNDESNQSRALLVLQSANLLKLKDGGSPFSTPEDVIADQSKVKVRPVDATQTGTSLPDVAGSIINNDFVEKSGLKPSDAIAKDDPAKAEAKPYINIWAARSDDANNEVYQKLVNLYQTNQKVLDGAQKAAGGTAVFVKTPVNELQEALKKTQEQVKAHKK